MMLWGTPNRKIIDLMKLTDVRAVELVIGIASIHLVNLSTATSRCVLPPFDDFLRGPTMSSPQVAKGQDNGMVLSSEAGACGLLVNFWQAMQRRTMYSAFFMAVDDAREVSVSFLVGYPKRKVRCSTAAVSSSKYWSLVFSRRTQR